MNNTEVNFHMTVSDNNSVQLHKLWLNIMVGSRRICKGSVWFSHAMVVSMY